MRQCHNLGLILDKFVPEEAIGKSEGKSRWLKEDLAPSSPDRLEMQVDLRLWEALYQRWLALTKAAGAESFQATLAWRMVVGLGGSSVLETDLTLDHLSGLPIIPGSALKGLTRAYAVQEEFKWSYAKGKEGPEYDPPEIKDLFGAQEQQKAHAGRVIFFDALPVPPNLAAGRLRFAVDIMNPHYPDYYRENGKHAPSNDQSPVPVTFLTVEGATFAFAVAPRSGVVQQGPERAEGGEEDHKRAARWLKEALQEYGVGGKTSAGYGFFREAPSQQPASQEAQGASVVQEGPPKPTWEQVEDWKRGKNMVGGVAQEMTDKGTIVRLSNEENAPRGFIVGVRLPPDTPVPPRKVIGSYEWQGEWFVKLSS